MMARIVRNYRAYQCKGLVERRRNRITKSVIGVYHAEQAGLEAIPQDPWATVCETHSSVLRSATLRLARRSMTYTDWCNECAEILRKRPA